MAITTLGAIALGVGAIGGVASAAIGSSATNRATDAATQAANQSAAVQREQLQAARTALQPYYNAGVPATNAINALLGLGGTTAQTPAPAQTPASAFGPTGPRGLGSLFGSNNLGVTTTPTTPTATPAVPAQTAQQAAQAGFDTFRNSTGYQFRLGEGMNALNSGYAGAGTIKSGAAMRAATEYGQNLASQEFGNYLGALGNQQALGMSAGSAMAGVGQNYANSLTQINSDRASAIGNAALLGARNTSNAIGGFTSGLNNILGFG